MEVISLLGFKRQNVSHNRVETEWEMSELKFAYRCIPLIVGLGANMLTCKNFNMADRQLRPQQTKTTTS